MTSPRQMAKDEREKFAREKEISYISSHNLRKFALNFEQNLLVLFVHFTVSSLVLVGKFFSC